MIKKLTILIPCLNEEKAIKHVVGNIPHSTLKRLGYETEVIVVDNNSEDNTYKVASESGVKVIREPRKGKGYALKAGLVNSDPYSDYIIMLDGDNTYKAKEIPRLLELLSSGFCDVVVGSRLGGKLKANSLRLSNRIANWFFTFLVRQIYRANITDVLSGYFAFTRKAIFDVYPYIETKGFAIEMELITKMVRMNHQIYSVPITYDRRIGESKLETIKDGIRILYTFIINITWKPNDNPKTPASDFKLSESL